MANRPGVKHLRDDLLAHLFLAAAVALVVWPLLAGQVLYYGDLTLQFIPWRRYAAGELLAGRLPLWVPDLYLGLPFLANDQSAVLYPWHWLSLALAPARQIALGCVFHLQLACSGMYCCGRRRGRTRAAAVCGALALGLGGFVLTKQQFPSLAYTIAWLPWLFWAAQRLEGRGLLISVGLVAVQWLAGHAQMSLLMLALVTAWQLTRPGGQGQRGRWLLAVGWGTLLAAAQWLPTAELLRWSARSGFTVADAARFNLPPWQLPQLLLGGLFGRPDGPLPWLGVGAFWETSCWVGLAAWPLALAGARRPWVVVTVGALVLAMGPYTPVYPWLARWVPGLTLFRDPARFTLCSSLALAWLATDGLDRAPAMARRWARRLAVALALAAGLAILCPSRGWQGLAAGLLARAESKSVADLAAVAVAWQAAVSTQLVLGAGLLGLLSALPAAVARRGWPLLLGAELVVCGLGVNPTTAARSFETPSRPAALPAGLVWVAPDELPEVARRAFGLSHYPQPPRLAEAQATLAGNQTLGTGVRQFAGYDPLRPAASLAWLTAREQEPAARREARLAALGATGEWVAGQFRAFPAAAPEVRREGATVHWEALTPQRQVASAGPGGDRLTWTRHWLPGWRWSGAAGWSGADAAVAAWRCGPGEIRLRTWYSPVSVRLGLWLSLVAAAGLAAGLVCQDVTGCSGSAPNQASLPAREMV